MRRHLQLGLALGAFTLALAGAACSRTADRDATYPQAQPVPVSYSEANKTSTTSAPNVPKAGVGYDSMQNAEGPATPKGPKSPSSSTMDNGGYDQSGVPNTGATDNVPSGIGGGPADATGGKSFKPAAPGDDNIDDSLPPDEGKNKKPAAKPQGSAKPKGGK